MPLPSFTVEPLGDAALVLRMGSGADSATAARVRAAADSLSADPPAGLVDLLPTFTTLAVCFAPDRTDAATFHDEVRRRVADPGEGARPSPRQFEIPVCYGGEAGPDLDAVAAATGLSAAEVVRLHVGTTHSVGMIGFAPGFPYLLGLPPALRLPRRATPRTAVPAGSVAIAEAQTGIYPRSSPGGWHVIGRTDSPLFDPRRDPPALLRTGDRVRFVPTAAAGAGPTLPDDGIGDGVGTTLRLRVPGIATTVEDAGRPGWRAAGVPTGGAADPLALRTANLLVGNPDSSAALEFTFQGPCVEFLRGAWVAFAGGEFAATATTPADGTVPLPARHAVWLPEGAVLTLGPPPSDAVLRAGSGIRGCLAIDGGIDVPVVLGSRSTCLRAGFGGHRGRRLRAGDTLASGPARLPPPRDPSSISVLPRTVAPPTADRRGADTILRAVAGPEWLRFPAAARDLLLGEGFTVGPASDRTGLRLEGPRLAGPGGILSEALVPGTVQVPPDGAPILVGVDAPVTGGYARIAVVATVDLPRLGQARPGERVRFVAVEVDEARRLLADRERDLERRRVGWECRR